MWEWISAAGKLVGGIGQAYGAIAQSRTANKMFDLQKQNQNREIAKENQAQNNLDTAISNVYGSDDKKKKNSTMPQFDLGV